jgi:hypothetical protein
VLRADPPAVARGHFSVPLARVRFAHHILLRASKALRGDQLALRRVRGQAVAKASPRSDFRAGSGKHGSAAALGVEWAVTMRRRVDGKLGIGSRRWRP